MCTEDRVASEAAGRPVGQPGAAVAQDEHGDPIYVTSELFQLTVPLKVVLSAPAGVLLDRVVQQLNLPRQHDIKGAIGVRYEYRLASSGRSLARNESLASQDVRPQAILWLEIEMTPFATRSLVHGAAKPVIVRGEFDERGQALDDARQFLKRAIGRAGLGY
jgi:hypothetical protein